jgi:hypothetical protein
MNKKKQSPAKKVIPLVHRTTEQELAANLRILFVDAIRLLPTGIEKEPSGKQLYEWNLFIADEMLKRVLSYVNAKEEENFKLKELLLQEPADKDHCYICGQCLKRVLPTA